MSAARFSRLEALMHDFIENRSIPGVDITVAKDYTPIFNFRGGYADREAKKPITDRTEYYLYSASKPITCAAVLRLVERGLLDPNAPLYEYMPEFSALFVADGLHAPHPAENPILVRDLFCMTNGYSYEYLGAVGKKEGLPCPTVPTVAHLASFPLQFEPHTSFAYGMGHDMLAALAEVITGKKYRDYLNETVFTPLGMTHTHMHPTSQTRTDLAALYEMRDGSSVRLADQRNGFILGDEYDSGGAGILSCSEDYLKFAVTITNLGQSADGYTLLRPETVERMRIPQLSAAELAAFEKNCSWLRGYSYGLGVRTHISPSVSGRRSPVGEFGWDGAAGSFVVFDPKNRLTIVYMQHVHGTPNDINHTDILNTVYSCMDL